MLRSGTFGHIWPIQALAEHFFLQDIVRRPDMHPGAKNNAHRNVAAIAPTLKRRAESRYFVYDQVVMIMFSFLDANVSVALLSAHSIDIRFLCVTHQHIISIIQLDSSCML